MKRKTKKQNKLRLDYERYKHRRQVIKNKGIGLDSQLSYAKYKEVRY